MHLLRMALHFFSAAALGIRQFGAECEPAGCVGRRMLAITKSARPSLYPLGQPSELGLIMTEDWNDRI
jgi:hypothetical protein